MHVKGTHIWWSYQQLKYLQGNRVNKDKQNRFIILEKCTWECFPFILWKGICENFLVTVKFKILHKHWILMISWLLREFTLTAILCMFLPCSIFWWSCFKFQLWWVLHSFSCKAISSGTISQDKIIWLGIYSNISINTSVAAKQKIKGKLKVRKSPWRVML